MLAAAVGGTDPAPIPTQGGAPQQPGLQHPALHPTCLIPTPFLPVRRSSRATALSQLCHGAGRGWMGSPRSPQASRGAGHLGACTGAQQQEGCTGGQQAVLVSAKSQQPREPALGPPGRMLGFPKSCPCPPDTGSEASLAASELPSHVEPGVRHRSLRGSAP